MKHVKNVNSVVETEMSRFEQVLSVTEGQSSGSFEQIRKEFLKNVQDTIKWKADFEDINSNKLLEVHAAIKLTNTHTEKKAADGNDRVEVLK